MRGRNKLKLSEVEINNRKNRRTLQNRINKRNQRLRIKIKKNISPTLSKEKQDEEYISNLINYFDTFEFDIHFTGTFEPKNKNKISLQSLKSYTDKFIQSLIDDNIIEYGLIFMDTGENENNHTHIVIKSNAKIRDTHSILKSKWLLGTNLVSKNIETQYQKYNTIKYGFKKMENTKKNKGQRMKTDLWNFIKR